MVSPACLRMAPSLPGNSLGAPSTVKILGLTTTGCVDSVFLELLRLATGSFACFTVNRLGRLKRSRVASIRARLTRSSAPNNSTTPLREVRCAEDLGETLDAAPEPATPKDEPTLADVGDAELEDAVGVAPEPDFKEEVN